MKVQPTHKEIRAGFIRQRKSLMGVSILLIFWVTVGIDFDELSIFGNRISLSNPALMELALWVAWLYFLIRYAQYFRDHSPTGMVDAYEDRMVTTLKKAAPKFAIREARENDESLHSDIAEIRVKHVAPGDRTKLYWEIGISGDAVYPKNADIVSSSYYREFKVLGLNLFILRVRSIIFVLLATRFGSEYFLPLGVAVTAILTKIFFVCFHSPS